MHSHNTLHRFFFHITLCSAMVLLSASCVPANDPTTEPLPTASTTSKSDGEADVSKTNSATDSTATWATEFSGISLADKDGIIVSVIRPVIADVSYPYHGSLVDLDGKHFLMTFRYDTGLLHSRSGFPITKIGLVKLDENLIQVGPTRFIETGLETAEDARLFKRGDTLWIAFNAAINAVDAKREMFVAALKDAGPTSNITATPIRLTFEDSTHQKNWVPFLKDDKLYFGYSLSPHKILVFNENTLAVEPVADGPERNIESYWKHGEIRGGTPAMPWENEYLAFFHSRFYSGGLYWYTFGAYTFEAQAPHGITRISKKPILFQDMYSTYANAIAGKKVIFPTGYVIRDNRVYLSVGENDSQIKILILHLDKLRQSLSEI